MEKLLFAVLLFPLSAFAVNGGDRWDINETINQTNFIVDDRCSGTLISLEHRLIVTNYHCIDHKVRSYTTDEVVDGKITEVEKERLLPVPVSQKQYGRLGTGYDEVGESEYQTRIVAKEQRKDLALLQMMAENIPHSIYSPVLPESMEVERGDLAYHVGNPAMLDATMTKGIISSVTRAMRVSWAEGEQVPFIQYDGGAFPGSSGGAIYNAEGYLIGNVTSGIDSSFAFALHPDLIQEFLYESCWPVYLGGNLKETEKDGDWHCADWGKREVFEKEKD